MSHRDSPIKKNKELKKPMDIMNVGFVGAAGGGVLMEATGGTITTVGDYKIHTFTSTGNSTFEITSGSGDIEYLVIAGGGGAGSLHTNNYWAGGGGAGGYRTKVAGQTSGGGSSAEPTLTLGTGSYTVTVGAGGAGGISSNPASRYDDGIQEP